MSCCLTTAYTFSYYLINSIAVGAIIAINRRRLLINTKSAVRKICGCGRGNIVVLAWLAIWYSLRTFKAISVRIFILRKSAGRAFLSIEVISITFVALITVLIWITHARIIEVAVWAVRNQI